MGKANPTSAADFAAPATTVASSLLTSAFDAKAAAKNREFQRNMSNTAHQREIADLKKAGLNPILSVSGAGSTTPSGSTSRTTGAPELALQHSQLKLNSAQATKLGEEANTQKTLQRYNTAQAVREEHDNTLRGIKSGLWKKGGTFIDRLEKDTHNVLDEIKTITNNPKQYIKKDNIKKRKKNDKSFSNTKYNRRF